MFYRMTYFVFPYAMVQRQCFIAQGISSEPLFTVEYISQQTTFLSIQEGTHSQYVLYVTHDYIIQINYQLKKEQ